LGLVGIDTHLSVSLSFAALRLQPLPEDEDFAEHTPLPGQIVKDQLLSCG
jgi:hypothetical protein